MHLESLTTHAIALIDSSLRAVCMIDNRYISKVLPFLVVVLTKSLVTQSRPLKQNHIIAPFVSSLDTFVLTAPIFDKPIAVAPSELKNIITEIPGRVFTRSAET